MVGIGMESIVIMRAEAGAIIVAVFGIVVGILGVLWARFYIKRQMLKLNEMLSLPPEEVKKAEYSIDETLDSKLYDRLSLLYRNLEMEYREADLEKEAVKRYIADLSHQMKTPMTNLSLYTDLLLEENLSKEEIRDFLNRIRSELDKMEWLHSGLTKVARLESGAVKFEIEVENVEKTMIEAVEEVKIQAEAKGIKLCLADDMDSKANAKANAEEDVKANAKADAEEEVKVNAKAGSRNNEKLSCMALYNRKWTVEALKNILENAVKYTEPGGRIRIFAEKMELYVRICIEDEGPGILKEDYHKIFKRFYRGENVKNEPGSGLGLYLAQLILNKENGYVTVSSEYGKGSCFSVYLKRCG